MRAHVIEDLREASGRWVLRASSHGYFDSSPDVEAATLEYRESPPDRMTFVARFSVRGRVRSLSGRQASTRGVDGHFRFSGFGMLLRVARFNWDLSIADDGEIMVAANSGSLVTPFGLLIFLRDDVVWPRADAELRSSHRDFGVTSSQMRLLSWRDERRRLAFPERRRDHSSR